MQDWSIAAIWLVLVVAAGVALWSGLTGMALGRACPGESKPRSRGGLLMKSTTRTPTRTGSCRVRPLTSRPYRYSL